MLKCSGEPECSLGMVGLQVGWGQVCAFLPHASTLSLTADPENPDGGVGGDPRSEAGRYTKSLDTHQVWTTLRQSVGETGTPKHRSQEEAYHIPFWGNDKHLQGREGQTDPKRKVDNKSTGRKAKKTQAEDLPLHGSAHSGVLR